METPRSHRSPAARHQEHTDLHPAQLAGCASAPAQSAAPAGRAQHGSGWSPGWGTRVVFPGTQQEPSLLSCPLHFAKRTREAASPCQGERAETFRLRHHPFVFPSVVTQRHPTEPESPPAKSHRTGGVPAQGCSRDRPRGTTGCSAGTAARPGAGTTQPSKAQPRCSSRGPG